MPVSSIIDELFGSVGFEIFSKQHFNRKALFVSGFKEKFKPLLDWKALNLSLDTSIFPNEDVKLVRNLEYRECRSISDLRLGLKDGFTLVFNNFHRINSTISALAQNVSSIVNEPTQVNLYLSHPQFNGFSLHYDTHDVLVFQIYGSKRWEIHEPTIDKPVDLMKHHDKAKPTSTPYLDVVLDQGDLLYVPRGHWHYAVPVGNEPSLHLTLGILTRTGLDFLEWLKSDLSENVIWRDGFTFQPELQVEMLAKSLNEILVNGKAFERYLEYRALNISKNGDLGLPNILLGGNGYGLKGSIVFIPQSFVILKKRDTDTFVLLFENKKLVLRYPAEQVVDFLLSREDLDLSRLPDYAFGLTENLVTPLLESLFLAGMLRIRN